MGDRVHKVILGQLHKTCQGNRGGLSDLLLVALDEEAAKIALAGQRPCNLVTLLDR
jgi:hypothetical protein